MKRIKGINMAILPPQAMLLILSGIIFSGCNLLDRDRDAPLSKHNEIVIPDDRSTIQAGIDISTDGDLVLVRPGVYFENLNLGRKSITLASFFYKTNDENYINNTIIDGQGSTVIMVNEESNVSSITGFTIRNGEDGISANALLNIQHNYITQNVDGVDYEGGGGRCEFNTFSSNRDDGIDLDGPTSVIIENNLIIDNADDGIEIRLHPFIGKTLLVRMYRNEIKGNKEDGIQLIDYEGISDRLILIERNIFYKNTMAAIGMMANGNTIEDYSGAPIPEPILVYNNTISDNSYGLIGGSNLIMLNNIINNTLYTAMRNVTGASVAAYNLFWNNAINYENSNIDLITTLTSDPLFGDDFQLLRQSPAIDAGTSSFKYNNDVVLELQAEDYYGAAPDIGAVENM